MAEIKFNFSLMNEIISLETGGDAVNDGTTEITKEGINRLRACVLFIEEHREIVKILKLYQKLILKDVKDLKEMLEYAQESDKATAQKLNGF